LAACRVSDSEAEYVCAPESSLMPKPARMAIEQVAALPQAGARPRITKGK
jgi:NADPH:quinone reductase-like Zn-dependent oxidoreductase